MSRCYLTLSVFLFPQHCYDDVKNFVLIILPLLYTFLISYSICKIVGIASFAPKELGSYQCSIFRDEKHIKGSPFTINVTDKELAHAAKVVVTGQTAEAKANTSNYVTVDTSGTGNYMQSVEVHLPTE